MGCLISQIKKSDLVLEVSNAKHIINISPAILFIKVLIEFIKIHKTAFTYHNQSHILSTIISLMQWYRYAKAKQYLLAVTHENRALKK